MTWRLVPWVVLLVAGAVVLYLNGLDPTGSSLVVVGMFGVATVTIRNRWAGAMSRLGTRLGDLRRRFRHR